MDVTLRNVDEKAFRTFKSRCAASGVTLGDAVSSLMSSYTQPKQGQRAKPSGTPPNLEIRDLGEHIRSLHSKEKENKGSAARKRN
ncbi:MAG: hypothetical protein V1708_03685 [Candidatus Micrarchaeota archaeon]